MTGLEEKMEKSKRLLEFSEEVVRKREEVNNALDQLLSEYDKALTLFTEFLGTIKKKRGERAKRLEAFMKEVKAMKEDSERDELENELLRLLIDRFHKLSGRM